MPRTTIRAASVTVLSGMPVAYIAVIVRAVMTGRPDEAMRAERSGNSISITKMTTSMEISRSRRKAKTERLTTFGWSVTRVRVTLSGISSSKSPSTFSTLRPKATMLLWGRISTERMRQAWPL